MAMIYYSMAGEGRGHAARARSVVECIKQQHKVVLLAPDEAFDFLAPRYERDPQVEVRRLPGLRFHYNEGRLSLRKSVGLGLGYLAQLGTRAAELAEVMRREKPALAIADFEAILPRAAERCGVPLVSLNHQHFLLAYDLAELPRRLRFHAWLMSWVVAAHHTWQRETIVSSFFAPPLRRGWERAVQVGPLLRPELTRIEPSEGEYLITYLRKHTPWRVVEMLAELDQPIVVYGLGERPSCGKLRFLAVDENSFMRHLAGCRAYIGAAGNQTIGEAIHLGKPLFVLPERKHHEQRINAHFVRQMGVGDWNLLESVESGSLRRFLDRLNEYRSRLVEYRGRFDGTPRAVEVIRSALSRAEISQPEHQGERAA